MTVVVLVVVARVFGGVLGGVKILSGGVISDFSAHGIREMGCSAISTPPTKTPHVCMSKPLPTLLRTTNTVHVPHTPQPEPNLDSILDLTLNSGSSHRRPDRELDLDLWLCLSRFVSPENHGRRL